MKAGRLIEILEGLSDDDYVYLQIGETVVMLSKVQIDDYHVTLVGVEPLRVAGVKVEEEIAPRRVFFAAPA